MITVILSFVFEEIILRVLMYPVSRLIRYRKKKIMEGIEIRSAKLNVHYDVYPDLSIHFTISSQTTANLKIKNLILSLQSGQWEFMRICANPSLDNIPNIIKARRNTTVDLKFNPPLDWWLESRSNINIKKAFLSATTMWGELDWSVNLAECSMDDHRLDYIGNQYLSRIGFKRKVKGKLNEV